MSTTKHEREEIDALAASAVSLCRTLVDAKIILHRRDRLQQAEMLALALLGDIKKFRVDYGHADRKDSAA